MVDVIPGIRVHSVDHSERDAMKVLSDKGLACFIGAVLGQHFIMRLSQAEKQIQYIGMATFLPDIEHPPTHTFPSLHVPLSPTMSSLLFQTDESRFPHQENGVQPCLAQDTL